MRPSTLITGLILIASHAVAADGYDTYAVKLDGSVQRVLVRER